MGQNMGQKKGGINELKYFRQKNLTAGSLLENEPEQLTNEHELLAKKHETHKLMEKDNIGRIFIPLNKVKENALENKISKVK